MMKSLSFLFVFLWLNSITLFGQAVPWERINPHPVESTLNEIINIPGSNRLMAVGNGATIMYSDDEGASWIISYKPAGISRMTNLNAIHFVDADLGYVAGDHSTLLKTTNNGASWTDISPLGDDDFFDVYFIDEQTGFVTKYDTIMKTTDGGSTWTCTQLRLHYYPKHLHFINDSTGYLGNTYGSYYFRTTNCGDSWDSVAIITNHEKFPLRAIKFLNENIGIASSEIYNISSSDHLILRTDDGGETWSEVYSHAFNVAENIYFFDSLTGFTVGPRAMYDNMILKTVDGGITWNETSMTGYNWWDLNSIAFLPDGTGFSVGSYGQIIKSTDWGEIWNKGYQRVINNSVINAAAAVNQTTAFIATTTLAGGGVPSGCIYRSSDGGYSWDKLINLWPFNSLFFLNSNFGVAASDVYGAVYKTTDGGNNWTKHEIDEYNFSPLYLSFISEQIGFVGGDDIIYKTTDGCETWEICLNNYVLFGMRDLAFSDDSTGFVVGYMPDIFLRTDDQGATWITDTFDVSINAGKLYFINADTGFVIGSKILKTTDGGDTWAEVPDGCEGYVFFSDIDFPTSKTGYITISGIEETLLKTVDGGDSWAPIGLMETTSTPNALAFFSADEGLVMGDNGIIFKTYTGGLVGVPENRLSETNNSSVFCYPNPVANKLTVKLENVNASWQTVEFYSVSGELVKKLITSNNYPVVNIDVSDMKTGVYVVVLRSGNKIEAVNKIVKL